MACVDRTGDGGGRVGPAVRARTEFRDDEVASRENRRHDAAKQFGHHRPRIVRRNRKRRRRGPGDDEQTTARRQEIAEKDAARDRSHVDARLYRGTGSPTRPRPQSGRPSLRLTG